MTKIVRFDHINDLRDNYWVILMQIRLLRDQIQSFHRHVSVLVNHLLSFHYLMQMVLNRVIRVHCPGIQEHSLVITHRFFFSRRIR